ncbi:unnamed protein product, partial [Mesorhabditis spiculigera]
MGCGGGLRNLHTPCGFQNPLPPPPPQPAPGYGCGVAPGLSTGCMPLHPAPVPPPAPLPPTPSYATSWLPAETAMFQSTPPPVLISHNMDQDAQLPVHEYNSEEQEEKNLDSGSEESLQAPKEEFRKDTEDADAVQANSVHLTAPENANERENAPEIDSPQENQIEAEVSEDFSGNGQDRTTIGTPNDSEMHHESAEVLNVKPVEPSTSIAPEPSTVTEPTETVTIPWPKEFSTIPTLDRPTTTDVPEESITVSGATENNSPDSAMAEDITSDNSGNNSGGPETDESQNKRRALDYIPEIQQNSYGMKRHEFMVAPRQEIPKSAIPYRGMAVTWQPRSSNFALEDRPVSLDLKRPATTSGHYRRKSVEAQLEGRTMQAVRDQVTPETDVMQDSFDEALKREMPVAPVGGRKEVPQVDISDIKLSDDPMCNAEELRSIMLEHMSESLNSSKRLVQVAAEERFGGRFDVICAHGDFSYVTNTELFCQETKNSVSCYTYRQL